MRANRAEICDGAEWGDLKVEFETFPAGLDTAPLLRGLPEDACPCPHWGYVFSGSILVHYRDHDETYRTGDAFYMPPGHVPVFLEDTDIFELSPAAQLADVMEVVVANASALESSAQPMNAGAGSSSSTFLDSLTPR
jgi:hypothetical protein